MARFSPRKVRSRAAATNPVARAIAWQRLLADANEAKTLLWALGEGDDCQKVVRSITNFFTAALIAAEHSKMLEHPEHRGWCLAVDEALGLVVQSEAAGWRWQKEWVVVFDDALDASMLITKHCKPESINVAAREWSQMRGKNKYL